MKLSFGLVGLLFYAWGASAQLSDAELGQLKSDIQQLSNTWDQAIKAKDVGLIKELYDINAHYLPDDNPAVYGVEAIATYWKASFEFMGGLKLNMESLEGTKDLLYETGKGMALVMGADGQYVDFNFKYVNVWKLQDDGSYKVVIDTYNSF